MLRRGRSAPLRRALLLGVVGVAVAGALAFSVGARGDSRSLPGDDSVAAGFARDMTAHHAQAVEMAEIIRDRTDDDALRLLAADIALTQQQQIGRMRGWLDVWGLPRTGSSGPMQWMGMTAHDAMPGMATRAAVDRLRSEPIDEAEKTFLELMIAHHKGGVAMISRVGTREIPDEVRLLADSIITSQRGEIEVMRGLLDERGESGR